MQRQLDVDILLFGHTHKCEVYEHENKFYINPGSITGAYSPTNSLVWRSNILFNNIVSKFYLSFFYILFFSVFICNS